MCGYCCGGTPVEKRGEGHRGCSVDCYNVPRPKPAAHVAELEAALAAAEARLRAVEALADWCDQQILGYSYRPRDIATSIRAALTPPQPAP